jgi:hypothetical protein
MPYAPNGSNRKLINFLLSPTETLVFIISVSKHMQPGPEIDE